VDPFITVVEFEAAVEMCRWFEMLVLKRLEFGQLQVADLYRHDESSFYAWFQSVEIGLRAMTWWRL
jgi:hypothetical protein